MESLDYWRLCDELNIIQAALLFAECDPGGEAGYVENWEMHQRPPGYEAAKTAISNALRRNAIKGKLIPKFDYDINGNICGTFEDSIDLTESRVEVESAPNIRSIKQIQIAPCKYPALLLTSGIRNPLLLKSPASFPFSASI